MKIGVITDCFKKNHTEGIELAAKVSTEKPVEFPGIGRRKLGPN